MIFGDISSYVVAQRTEITVRVLRERWADNDQVGFLLSERVGGALYNPDGLRVGIVLMSESTLATALELKSVDASQRFIEGYASVSGVLDRQGDIVEPEAFTKSLAERPISAVGVYVEHQSAALPVGKPIEIREDGRGLFTRTKIHRTTDGDNLLAVARERSASGSPLGLSIGYQVRDWARDHDPRSGNSVRYLRDVVLNEYSYTLRPANTAALVTRIKSKIEMLPRDVYRDWADELAEWLAEAKRAQAELERR